MLLTCSSDTTWFQGFSNLFCSKNLLPLSNMTLEEQINAITRMVLIIFVIILLFDVKCSTVFLTVSLLFIILLYYLQRNMIDKIKSEPFETQTTPTGVPRVIPKGGPLEIPNSPRVAKKEEDDPEDNSKNPRYQPPPKAKVNYIYTHYDYELKTKEKSMFCDDQVDMFDRVAMNQKLAGKPNPKTLIQPVSVPPVFDPSWRATNMTVDFKGANNREGALDLYQSGYVSIDDIGQDQVESYHSNNSSYRIRNRQTDMASAFGEGNDNSFHKRNMNTQTIQPGVYFENDMLEPISTNMGITETKKYKQPVKNQTDNGDVYYNEYNNDAKFNRVSRDGVGPEDIYDPRFTGYGTSYRSYFDEFIGQPKFYYDDVNAMRMPNYLVRSKIDHLGFADQYGPMNDDYQATNDSMREMVNQSFLDNSLGFRNDLQERLMRKRNAEMAYIRQFPKRTSGQRMMGGLGFRG